MNYNRDVIVSRHVCERYLERFPDAVDRKLPMEDQIREAAAIIKRAFSEARYLSDREPDPSRNEKGGILFANDVYGMKLIVRECKIVTVMPTSRKGETSVGKSNLYHGPTESQKSKVKNQKEAARW